MSVAAPFPAARADEVPLILGRRVLLCGFSAVAPLMTRAGLDGASSGLVRRVCAQAALAAPPAAPSRAVGAVIRDLRAMADGARAAFAQAPGGDRAWAWLHAHDRGWGAGDPAGFWAGALRWAGRTSPQLGEGVPQRLVRDHCGDVYSKMTDPSWREAVDAALSKPFDDADAAIAARQGYDLLEGAAVGGDINQIALVLGPMRDWSILVHAWRGASGETRQALPAVGPAFVEWERRERGVTGTRFDAAWFADPVNAPARVFGDV